MLSICKIQNYLILNFKLVKISIKNKNKWVILIKNLKKQVKLQLIIKAVKIKIKTKEIIKKANKISKIRVFK